MIELSSTPCRVFGLLVLFALLHAAAAGQYVEFKNRDGKAVTAVPLETSAGNVRLRAKNGQQFVLPINKLSDADQDFLFKWSPPKIEATITALPSASKHNANPSEHHAVQISIHEMTQVDGKRTSFTNELIAFQVSRRQELIDALEEFIRESDAILQLLGTSGQTHQLSKIRGSKCRWNVRLLDHPFLGQQLFLVAEDKDKVAREEIDGESKRQLEFTYHAVECDISLNHAFYLHYFLSKYDAVGELRKHLEATKSK